MRFLLYNKKLIAFVVIMSLVAAVGINNKYCYMKSVRAEGASTDASGNPVYHNTCCSCCASCNPDQCEYDVDEDGTVYCYCECCIDESNQPQYDESENTTNYKYITAKKCSEKAIQAALNKAKKKATDSRPYYIRVPNGTFKMKKGLHIYSNTTLNLYGVTIKNPNKKKGAIIQVGYPRKEGGKKGYKKGGYTRGRNIIIKGGTLNGGTKAGPVSSLVTFSHVKNITFDAVTFKFRPNKTDNAHLIEFGAAKDVTIKNCKFYGNKKVCEALQIESAVKKVAHSELMGKEDGTTTRNVVIANCLFDNFVYALGTNHGCSKDVYRSMIIKNNTFKHIKKYCVCTYNYRGVVSGNKAVKCGNKRRIFKLGKNNNVIDRKNNW